ncbi:MAG: TRAP transporter fused permease subunit [Acetobacteraceae bacterium]|nr:TRAP transporter fused permease subunit [Acetobacteraceae bacterium]
MSQVQEHALPPEASALDEATAARVEELIEEEEGAQNRHRGWLAVACGAGAVAMSLFHLYAAIWIVPTMYLRYAHVGFMLCLTFLLYPVAKRFRHRLMAWDLLLFAAALYVTWYLVAGGYDLQDRYIFPETWDLVVGWALIILVLEATRRTTGWIMPAISIAFMLYAFFGNLLPRPWQHQGYDALRLIPHLTITLDGIFGTAVDVSSTLIILFTIFGAVLQVTGAGKFFVDLSFALLGRRASAAGRTVVLSSFLLGGPSGSGVATTVTLGAVAWPMMKRVGYHPADAGGLLAAGGLGAIISPPVLGAAAFLIAEFLKISYLQVITMAIVPTCLYYASLLFMVELDQRRIGIAGGDDQEMGESAGALLSRYWFHLSSLVSIVAFLLVGYSATLSVVYASGVAAVLSWLRRECRMTPARLWQALRDGSVQVLNVAATCACAGIIVGVVTLTGLGLKFSEIAISYAGGSLPLTALYTGLIVWVIGLAVPVTASYIISAVIAAPALTKLGVPDYAAHMFIFYYAVLSEVSPPTALSPFAAAAITGAGPYETTMQAWKYTLPAFLLPFVFVTDPIGTGLLLQLRPGMTWLDAGWVTLLSTIGLALLAAACQGYLLRLLGALDRALLVLAGLLLVFPAPLEALSEWLLGRDLPSPHWLGLAVAAVALAIQGVGKARSRA